MNIYLRQIVGQKSDYADKTLIRHVIAPNISTSWKIYFTLKENYRKNVQAIFRIPESMLEFNRKLYLVDLAGSECAKTASLEKSCHQG